jgi:DNA polymerase III delta prime subunit
MPTVAENSTTFLAKCLASERIHSGYVLSGLGEAPRAAALDFARGIVCKGPAQGPRPCGTCDSCRRSVSDTQPVDLDGREKPKGPAYRHVCDHSDLFWIELGATSTRVTVWQIRALQAALGRPSPTGGHRVAVIADADWLNENAQNALLRLIEEPPPGTSFVLAVNAVSSLLATLRSRCIRVPLPTPPRRNFRDSDESESIRAIVERLDAIQTLGMPELLVWAEEYRGKREVTVGQVNELLTVSCEWLRERILQGVNEGHASVQDELDAYQTILKCRRELTRRNTNCQMTAERGLFAIRSAVHS